MVGFAAGCLDVLINNAGISIRHDFLDITPDEWDRTLAVNLTGVFHVAQIAARHMVDRGGGVIVMTASTNGIMGYPHYADYNATKAGVIALVKAMAPELAPRVRVNAVAPGYVLTPMQRPEYTDAMLAPLQASGGEAAAFEERRTNLAAEPWCDEDDSITAAQIAAITSGARDGPDTVHRLVMDMHKALNGLQAHIASETIEGAHAYGMAPGDRELVAAFMRGVNRTAGLKFDHPGLGTTATRSGARLVIQNDIGTTEAHVLVVHVEGVEAIPHTGRAHQIRAHLRAAGFLLAGDALYGGAPLLARPALHAWSLAFRHPSSGEWRRFEAPYPPDLAAALAALRESRD